MAAQKQRRIACFLLIAVLLLTGVCFESSKADSFFAYRDAAAGALVRGTLRGRAVSPHLCARELQGDADCAWSKQGGGQNENTSLLMAALLSASDVASQNFTFVQEQAGTGEQFSRQNSTAVIIRYIHHQDGSK